MGRSFERFSISIPPFAAQTIPCVLLTGTILAESLPSGNERNPRQNPEHRYSSDAALKAFPKTTSTPCLPCRHASIVSATKP
jgi:hypothetical protein